LKIDISHDVKFLSARSSDNRGAYQTHEPSSRWAVHSCCSSVWVSLPGNVENWVRVKLRPTSQGFGADRPSPGDLSASRRLREENEKFRETCFVDIAESALSIGTDPLWMLLAQSFANHSLQFGVGLNFRGHEVAG
jgi:hypothetical protein